MTRVPIVPDGELAFGMQLPIQALSTRFAAAWERDAGVADLARVADAADRSGFLYVAVCDHIAIPEDLAPAMSTTWFHPLVTLGFLAAITTRTRVMSSVLVAPYRHPLEIAKAFASLDVVSGGRAILGVGAGHLAGEFDALGVPFADRGPLLDAAIDRVRAAWSSEFVDGMGQRPQPVQPGGPPIWVGGSASPALRRVAARGDGWIPQGTPRTEMPAQIAELMGYRQQLRPEADIEIGAVTELCYLGRPGWELEPGAVHGSAEQVAESLSAFGAMGVSHLQVRLASRSVDELCDQIARFGAEVGPLLSRD